jgi:ferritin-like protein
MSDSNKHHVVGVEFLKQNGVDVDALIKELSINASVEFVAYYYFTNLRSFCTGMEGEGIKGVIEDARLEDLSHFESCIDRIFQLGGEFPKDIVDFCNQTGADFLQSDKSTTLKENL